MPDYTPMAYYRSVRETGSNPLKCQCLLCKTYRCSNLRWARGRLKKPKPGPVPKATQPAPKPINRLLCFTCFGEIVPDLHHTCSPANCRDNLKKLVRPRDIEILAAENLREKELNNIPMTLATAGSRPMTVIRKDYKYVKMEKKSQQMVSIEAFKRAQVETGVSSKVTMTFAKTIRHDVTVESNLRPDLIFMKKRYADHFTVSNEVIDGKSVPVVHCKDSSSFLDCILQDRGCEKSSVFLRLSIDEGRGFLKVSGNLIDKDKEQDSGIFKASGVKRTFILAISPAKESYQSIKMLLEKINLKPNTELSEFFAQDMKSMNLVCGMGNHKSTYPCAYCYWPNAE